MILSPPFLVDTQANERDGQFVLRCMPGGEPGDGGFPVSFQMNWHGGLHLQAPAGVTDVRAIADGTIAFLRQPTARTAAATHPLNYLGGWSDDGCVILRHDTEIGANAAGAATAVTFFSIYMHLTKLTAGLRQGDRIYRKSILGKAGSIYSVQDRIHFEIVSDDANAKLLLGRTGPYTDVSGDGRTDAVFGSMHFLILIDTPFLASDPRGTRVPPAVAFTNTKAQFVVMTFSHGDCTMQTLDLGGGPVGAAITEAHYEYDMQATAKQNYPHSPAAGYELLRFGRVLGRDALNPADAPHWRKVAYPGGSGWVNLNGTTVRKFSDADFPFWDHWSMLVDGQDSEDSRCRNPEILQRLDANGDLNVTPQEAQQKLQDPELQLQMAHKVCKFRTEWDASTIDLRWSWLQTDPQTRMDAASYARFKAHVTALCFWEKANLGIDGAHWHFQPRHFIEHFRKCGWMSLDEFSQLMPRRAGATQHATAPLSWTTARQRFSPLARPLNLVFRRYNLLDSQRQVHFLAQIFLESIFLSAMRELGRGRQQRVHGQLVWLFPAIRCYNVFYGRGLMQLTWPSNYDAYGSFRQFPHLGAHDNYTDDRITHTSTHFWEGCESREQLWFPRYDPELVADDSFNACDSGGFFWVSKNVNFHHPERISINRSADEPFSPQSVGTVSVLVNGGGNGFADRQSFAAFIMRYRGDSTATAATGNFTAQHGHTNFDIFVDFTPQRP